MMAMLVLEQIVAVFFIIYTMLTLTVIMAQKLFHLIDGLVLSKQQRTSSREEKKCRIFKIWKIGKY